LDSQKLINFCQKENDKRLEKTKTNREQMGIVYKQRLKENNKLHGLQKDCLSEYAAKGKLPLFKEGFVSFANRSKKQKIEMTDQLLENCISQCIISDKEKMRIKRRHQSRWRSGASLPPIEHCPGGPTLLDVVQDVIHTAKEASVVQDNHADSNIINGSPNPITERESFDKRSSTKKISVPASELSAISEFASHSRNKANSRFRPNSLRSSTHKNIIIPTRVPQITRENDLPNQQVYDHSNIRVIDAHTMETEHTFAKPDSPLSLSKRTILENSTSFKGKTVNKEDDPLQKKFSKEIPTPRAELAVVPTQHHHKPQLPQLLVENLSNAVSQKTVLPCLTDRHNLSAEFGAVSRKAIQVPTSERGQTKIFINENASKMSVDSNLYNTNICATDLCFKQLGQSPEASVMTNSSAKRILLNTKNSKSPSPSQAKVQTSRLSSLAASELFPRIKSMIKESSALISKEAKIMAAAPSSQKIYTIVDRPAHLH
jgi:hypothetical protein